MVRLACFQLAFLKLNDEACTKLHCYYCFPHIYSRAHWHRVLEFRLHVVSGPSELLSYALLPPKWLGQLQSWPASSIGAISPHNVMGGPIMGLLDMLQVDYRGL